MAESTWVCIDKKAFPRPTPCTPRVLMAMVGRSPDQYIIREEFHDRRTTPPLDEEWRAWNFLTIPKFINGG